MLIDRKLLVVLLLLLSFVGFGQKLSRAENAQNIQIDSLLLKGVIAMDRANFDEAIANIKKAEALSLESKNSSNEAISNQLLTKIYYELGQYELAGPYILNAIKLHQELQELNNLGQDYIIYSQILIKTGNSEKALPFLENAEIIYQNQRDENSRVQLATTYLYEGNIYQELKQDEEALTRFQEAEALLKKTQSKNNYLLCRVYLQEGKTNLQLGQLDPALEYATSAHEISLNNNYPQLEVDALNLLSKVHSERKEYEEAFSFLSLYNQKRLTYFGDANNNVKNTAIRNALLANINADDYDPGKRVQANKITTVLIIALFTILCLLALSLYKNNNLRAKANELLQAKNAELMIAKENAEKASVVKAQFLSTITHELRTPMYAVTGLTHLLLSENPTEEQKKHLDSLKFSGEYLLSLINNILDLNKLEADKVEVEQATFNLRKRVDDVLFALERSAQEKGNKLTLEYDEEIPDQIIGDPLMISQILINLIGNGNKFTRDGDIFIRIKQLSRNDTQTYLHFEVEDTGEGISKKKQKDIFQNFTQGSVQINRKFGGTGLGLSIVKRLLSLQKSKIELESTLGKGSKFFFDIKYGLAKSKANEPEERVYNIDYEALKGRKLLVVEDNKINQMITRKILEKNEMECEVADNGEIAIEKVRFEPFDLVLMDIHMPGISGIEATQKIREFNKDLPILALTAVTIDENIDDFYLAGFNDIIPKPYKVEEFFFKIHNALKRKNVIL
ncbi:hybrid sensor histidine kinase/response regulator [Leeuwenhoekiella blandensis]|uniref:hybrid sensor histidine kinase/response regulator n=1 Tax=Leeuwenhoekiella blandensis TaxID=360293 RepID=UPI002353D043|nr:response regulator [Leeuwenhoekiella blandensis]|tara:strand:- start:9805 stop:12015 length:2211 start_codon:yes stop_codon:yes gene_type:complete